MPRDKAFRNCVVADVGNVLLVADFSMMELRAMAEIAADNMMRSDLANGVDLHRQLARAVHGLPPDAIPSPEQRNGAKAGNFGIIYGCGPLALVDMAWANHGVVLTFDQAVEMKRRFLSRYSAVDLWMRNNAKRCQQRGVIEIGRGGRVILAAWEAPGTKNTPARYPAGNGEHHDGDFEDDEDTDALETLDVDQPVFDDGNTFHRHPAHNQNDQLRYALCCNAPIQGACAEIPNRAVALFARALARAGIPGGLVLAIHDELVAEVSEEHAEAVAKLLADAMVQAFSEYFPSAPINGLVTMHMVKSWGEAMK
jgi:DNA polymerase I-like protein with 3'-5' exonuclease and polymerase domains